MQVEWWGHSIPTCCNRICFELSALTLKIAFVPKSQLVTGSQNLIAYSFKDTCHNLNEADDRMGVSQLLAFFINLSDYSLFVAIGNYFATITMIGVKIPMNKKLAAYCRLHSKCRDHVQKSDFSILDKFRLLSWPFSLCPNIPPKLESRTVNRIVDLWWICSV